MITAKVRDGRPVILRRIKKFHMTCCHDEQIGYNCIYLHTFLINILKSVPMNPKNYSIKTCKRAKGFAGLLRLLNKRPEN